MDQEEKKRDLNKLIREKFSDRDLRQLCFDLKSVDYEELQGDTKSIKIQDLLIFLEQRERLQEVVDWIAQNRPDIDISKLHVGTVQDGRGEQSQRIQDRLRTTVATSTGEADNTQNNMNILQKNAALITLIATVLGAIIGGAFTLFTGEQRAETSIDATATAEYSGTVMAISVAQTVQSIGVQPIEVTREIIQEIPVTVEVFQTIESDDASSDSIVEIEVTREVPITVEVIKEIPIEIEVTRVITVEVAQISPNTPTPIPTITSFALNLNQYEVGSIVPDLGSNIVIGQMGEKYIRGRNENGIINISRLSLNGTFKLSLDVNLVLLQQISSDSN